MLRAAPQCGDLARVAGRCRRREAYRHQGRRSPARAAGAHRLGQRHRQDALGRLLRLQRRRVALGRAGRTLWLARHQGAPASQVQVHRQRRAAAVLADRPAQWRAGAGAVFLAPGHRRRQRRRALRHRPGALVLLAGAVQAAGHHVLADLPGEVRHAHGARPVPDRRRCRREEPPARGMPGRARRQRHHHARGHGHGSAGGSARRHRRLQGAARHHERDDRQGDHRPDRQQPGHARASG